MKLALPKVAKAKGNQGEEVTNFPVRHYSASSMIKFSSNPVMFKILYINGDVLDTTSYISGVIGKAFHQAMEVYYGGSDTLLPSNEQEAIEYGLKAGMSFLEGYNDGFIRYNKNVPTKQKAFELFAFAFNSYVAAHPYKPDSIVAVEDEIKLAIDVEWRDAQLTLPVPLKGYLDKVMREDGKLKIVDYKTTRTFSNADKIDGAKMLQAVEYFLLAYAKYGEEPYSVIFEEVKLTKNDDKSSQVRRYEIVFADNPLYFDFYFRFYQDMTDALNGKMVYVPNVHTLYDNEVAMVSYIHRLDVPEETAVLMKKLQVDNITDLLKKQIQSAGAMRKLMAAVEANFVSAKNLNYDKMTNQEKIQTKMMEHGMILQFDSLVEGATFDLYRYTPSIGLKMSKLRSYVADVEQVLGVKGIRVLAPIPDSTLVGFEVPRKQRTFPHMPKPTGDFLIAIGQDILGNPRYFDIRKAPHVLVAGASGAGKSVLLSALIKQLSAIPKVELHLFDPKMVELAPHKDDAGVVEYESDEEEIARSLKRLVKEMNKRYELMAEAKVRDISGMPKLPYKFVIIDEFGDLTAGNTIKSEVIQHAILLLAQKARAAGIHLIIATQRPSVDVISGTIKANFPTKIVLKTARAVDSQIIIDDVGAEKLAGMGDLLFAGDHGIERLQGYMA